MNFDHENSGITFWVPSPESGSQWLGKKPLHNIDKVRNGLSAYLETKMTSHMLTSAEIFRWELLCQ